MLLEHKTAVVYGAGGSIGGAIARAFAREGARLYIAGRTLPKVEAVADGIRAAGGAVETCAVDALDATAVDAFVDRVVGQARSVDVSVNVIGYGDVQQRLMEISVDDFLQPIVNAMRSQLLTTRAAARQMIRRGSGVILHFAGGGPQTLPGLGGFKIALDAIEGIRRQWAVELGPYGIRVVTLRTGGVPESLDPSFPGRAEIEASIVGQTQPGRAATLEDVGNVAAFVASDRARTITSTEVNISAGAIVD